MTDDLSLRETSGEVSVEWKIKDFFSQPKQNGHFLKSPTFRRPLKNEGWGWPKFVKVSELSDAKDDMSEDGSLTIFCIVRDTASRVIIRRGKAVDSACQTSSQENPLELNFKDLLLNERHFDTTINVQDREFRAHKSLLVARSPVFASMFDHDMVEKACGAINIDDCDPEYFQDFLRFMYTGKWEIVTSANAIALYKAADKYNVEELKEKCVMCMSHELSADTFCDVVLTAVTHDESKLLNTTTDYFIENFGKIVRSPKWHSFLAEHHMLANELLVKLADKSFK